jgi:hypothetical protein
MKFTVPFTNATGARCVVVVELSDDEAADACRNSHFFSTSPPHTRHSMRCGCCLGVLGQVISCRGKSGACTDAPHRQQIH